MSELVARGYSNLVFDSWKLQGVTKALRASGTRRDQVVLILVIIAIALVVAVGLAVAWWITCQNKGKYPALDMPSWQTGGTWRAYCK